MNMERLLTYKTKVNYATSKTKSLKTGFPQEISKILEVEAGDVVLWCVNIMDNKIIVTIECEEDK